MDERVKAKILVFGFIVFMIAAAFIISKSRDTITGGAVVEGCEVECHNNEDCNDYNEYTLDGCAYPGTCAAKCFHEKK